MQQEKLPYRSGLPPIRAPGGATPTVAQDPIRVTNRSAKRLIPARCLLHQYNSGGDSMPIIRSDRAIPAIVPNDVPSMSDDECLLRLAQAVEDHDAGQLDEVAWLIGRLAVPIE
jgi:hypothetical protein